MIYQKQTKIYPKKSLGQNFLRDPKILSKIVESAEIDRKDIVIEIGPGEGTLTEIILNHADKVITIEKDRDMIETLNKKFKKEIENNKLDVINQDILDFNIEDLESYKKPNTVDLEYKLLGNIPYYITGAIFKKFLESKIQPKSMTFVVQKEVADRIMARDGKESILSISIKAYGIPKYGGIIKAGSFFPRPNVDSGIINIKNISKVNFENISEDKFFEVLKTGFYHKRKLLIKNLTELENPKISIEKLERAFEKAGIEKNARAEDISVENWIILTKNLI